MSNEKNVNLDVSANEQESNITQYNKSDVKQKIKFNSNCRWLIHVNMTVYGIVESKDVIGSIIKTSNAYLDNYCFEKLQDDRRVGRIQMQLTKNREKMITSVTVIVPVNHVDYVVAVVAAGLKVIDKVASYKCISTIVEIEDNQISNKAKIIKQAKLIYNTKFKNSNYLSN